MKRKKMHSFFKQVKRAMFDPAAGTDRFSLGERSSPHLDSTRLRDPPEDPPDLTGDPAKDAEALQSLFGAPRNGDFLSSEIRLTNRSGQSFSVRLLFLRGMTDNRKIDDKIVRPLLEAALQTDRVKPETLADFLVHATPTATATSHARIKEAILDGAVAILTPGVRRAVLVQATKVEHRAVGDAKTELVIRGPHEGFVESLETNISLVRKILRSENLVTEYVPLQEFYQTKAAVMYLSDLANEKLVEEVKLRLEGIKMESIANTLVLQQLLEDKPNSLIPTLSVTERPDRASGAIIDGGVIVLSGHAPFAILCPTTLWTLFHTSEEIYTRTAYANFVRFVRLFATFFALFAPGVYIALVNFQPEMLPTDLMFHIAGNRELLPFPTLVEILLMELAFELIREAGIRIPSVIGSTIGIVGALILGQAAVQANLVSPLLVILVSITGLGSFAVPNQDLAYAVRLGRFLFLFLGSLLGFFGISLGVVFMLGHMVSLQSFGVPFLAPLYPHMSSNRDFIFRKQLWKQEEYGQFTRPKKLRRVRGAIRVWKNLWEDRSP
ncbi:spore germination protein [Paenibacillus antri]|uniref:Spore germination protein n=1 Tax=Paenibacillus antri TaxID=2582848 RepID=A0A5R9GJE9_9BACL|nr:spore germination protein [Paenibacillus antri]TLS53624.1 spore germination protein [Paenibacillus antri]